MRQSSIRTNLTTLQSVSQTQDFPGCYDTVAPPYTVAVGTGHDSELQRDAAPSTHTPPEDVTDQEAAVPFHEEQFTLSTNREKFQAEVKKWEEFYDQIQQHLSAGSGPSSRSMPKSASNFSMGQDGSMYFCKALKDGSRVYLKVVRDYADRVRICKDIHHDTGDVTLHHRRDKMLELLGQIYYWKGQRRDVCRCVSIIPYGG